jgi:ABC-2 type transport system ATP-binding protein
VASGTPLERVEEVLEEVGLRAEARRRVGTFSLGMQQRLSIGLALLRRPSLLVLDEPTNGLDPDGIHWLRETLRAHARRGGSAIVSSHALAEVAQVADHALVLHQGRSLAAGPIDDLLAAARPPSVHVRTAAPERLVAVLAAAGHRATASGPATVRVDGASGEQVHAAAVTGDVAVAELVEVRPTLEEVFLRLSHQPTPPGATPSIREEEPCCAAHVQSC